MGGVGEKIMVSALTGLMSPVLGKLTTLIEKKYTELKNTRKILEQLRKELMAINLALEKHAFMESPDVQVKAWVSEMREMAYDMEDSIDLFTHHVHHQPADTIRDKSFFRKKIRKLKKLHYRYRFAEEIKDLLARVKEAEERRKRYKIEEGSSSVSHMEIDPRLQALFVEVENLVGIEKPSQEIIGQLVGKNPEERRRVVSIVGPGGSGKTTLANQVYQKIKHQFYCAAFVSVSQKPNMNNLLRELQYKIGVPGSRTKESCSDQQLIEELRSYLENTRLVYVFFFAYLIHFLLEI
jgi:ATPase subunit of ABC transporter with duplicated ATPase domains